MVDNLCQDMTKAFNIEANINSYLSSEENVWKKNTRNPLTNVSLSSHMCESVLSVHVDLLLGLNQHHFGLHCILFSTLNEQIILHVPNKSDHSLRILIPLHFPEQLNIFSQLISILCHGLIKEKLKYSKMYNYYIVASYTHK